MLYLKISSRFNDLLWSSGQKAIFIVTIILHCKVFGLYSVTFSK